jgi:hypothetical protein
VELQDTDRSGKRAPVSISAIVQLTRTTAVLAARFRCDPASRGSALPLLGAIPIAGDHDAGREAEEFKRLGEAAAS